MTHAQLTQAIYRATGIQSADLRNISTDELWKGLIDAVNFNYKVSAYESHANILTSSNYKVGWIPSEKRRGIIRPVRYRRCKYRYYS